MDAVFIGNGFYHEVGGVSDIRIRTHKHGAAGNRGQKMYRNSAQAGGNSAGKSDGARCGKKHQVSRRIIKKAG